MNHKIPRKYPSCFNQARIPSKEKQRHNRLLPDHVSLGIKTREGALEIKRRVEVANRLERWLPVLSEPFPVAWHPVREAMAATGGGCGSGDVLALDDLAGRLLEAHPNLVQLVVRKDRHHFQLDGCKAEADEIIVAGRKVGSAALEHHDPSRLLSLLRSYWRHGWRNAGYPEALRDLCRE